MGRDDEYAIRKEADALLRGAGLVRDDAHAVLRVMGADRLDYLHRMLTQSVSQLAAGQVAYGCLLSVKGRILGDILLWNVGDHLRLETCRAALPAVQPPLERYVIADDVVFAEATAGEAAYVLAGPDALGALVSAGFTVPVEGAFVEVEVGGEPALCLRRTRRGLMTFEIRLPEAAAPALEERLVDTGDVLLAGPRAWAWGCVHHGIPLFGRELGEDVLFNEVGLEEAIQWGKGCFPGQEPVVMAKHRGHPPRRLVALDLENEHVVERGADVCFDGTSIGRVTSWAPPLAHRAACALAFVRHGEAVAGRRVQVTKAGPAAIRALGAGAEER